MAPTSTGYTHPEARLNRGAGACQYGRVAGFGKRFRSIAAALSAASVLLLGACETPLVVQKLPELTYGHLPSFLLDVATIEVESAYRPSMRPPDVEHLFPTPPEKALRRWASDRLSAEGRAGTARFVITEARVTEKRLAVDKGLAGVFKMQQSERYDAAIEASVEIFDDRGFRRAFAGARATRSRTLGEDASVNERERLWFEIVEEVMELFDAEIEKNIRQHMGGYLR